MVSPHRKNHLFIDIVFLEDTNTDFNVGSSHFVTYRLPDVMEKGASTSNSRVGSNFLGNNSRDMRHFN